MNTRHLFLVGYDIRENPIRRRALRDVQHHALGGQKSFYEYWLSVAELQTCWTQCASASFAARAPLLQRDAPSFAGDLHFVGAQAQATPLPTQWSAP